MYRTWKTVILTALLAAVPVWASDGADADKDASSKESTAAKSSAAAKSKPAAKNAGKDADKSAAPSYGAEIEQLREMVLQQ